MTGAQGGRPERNRVDQDRADMARVHLLAELASAEKQKRTG